MPAEAPVETKRIFHRQVLADPEAGDRYNSLVEKGKEIFAGSPLLLNEDDSIPEDPITENEINLIRRFNFETAPPRDDYRLQKPKIPLEPLIETKMLPPQVTRGSLPRVKRKLQRVDAQIVKHQANPERLEKLEKRRQGILKNIDYLENVGPTQLDILRTFDSSTFGNWELPGGPEEHNELAMNAAYMIVGLVQQNLRTDLPEEIASEFLSLNPFMAKAAAGTHDIGRRETHRFYTNDLIGQAMAKAIGIRPDIIAIWPDEEIMQVPEDGDMNAAILSLTPLQAIMRIADELGKRSTVDPTRLAIVSDYTLKAEQEWAKKYMANPELSEVDFGGEVPRPNRINTETRLRPSDEWMQQRMKRHVGNVRVYFEGLNNYLETYTTLTLDDIAQRLNEELGPTLPPLPAV